MDCSVVTCVTGNFNKVHFTDVEKAFVCTTLKDKLFESHANSNGWEVKQLPLNHTYDLKEGTRQSKYVKFLKFFVPETKYVIYADHKYKVLKEHLPLLIDVLGDNSFLSFTNSKNIYREFFDSLSFDRYKKDLDEMIRTLKDQSNIDLENINLFYGGLIMYNTQHEKFNVLRKKMEDYTNKYNHVQDQLLFPLALKDENKILVHNTFGIKHESPQLNVQGKTY
tara:strand:+ start:2801 stop:3469 length:669 start_codon:yes stop_codon:yes gene_type:complete